jgi:hypothetical protein
MRHMMPIEMKKKAVGVLVADTTKEVYFVRILGKDSHHAKPNKILERRV